VPSNTEQGYVLRRLIRRAIRFGNELGIETFTKKIAKIIFKIYEEYEFDEKNILEELEKEEEKFMKTLLTGLKKFQKLTSGEKKLSGKNSFLLYQSFGFPIEMIIEECKKEKISFDPKEFEKEFEKHQKLSQTATAGKFKSGLADHSKDTTRLHTAAHMLLAALQKTLGENVIQKGSNITPERLRFDFSFDRKLSDEEIKKIENLINEKINEKIPIIKEEMSLGEARKKGAKGIFENKYSEKVFVYTIGDFSKEICAGPHVKNTSELGKFKITKEQSSSSGVRRIKAILE
jgi:alanyl-tRNA synthetase